MSIAFDSQCLLCHLRRNLEVVKPLGTEEQAMEFARSLGGDSKMVLLLNDLTDNY